MNIIEVNIEDIKPYKRNPRNNQDAVDYVMESIKEFGFKVPIILDKENTIVAGHTRYLACKNLGYEKIPCIVADDLTKEQIKAFRLADNKVAEFATWDFDLLNNELVDLLDFDMSIFGFDMITPLEPIVEDDFVPEIPETPIAKLGDIYQLGNHRLMCGDSTKVDDVQRLMGGKKAKMVFTDPPWNVDYGTQKNERWKLRTILNDSMSTEDFNQFLMKAFDAIKTVSLPGCMVYTVMSGQEWGNIMQVLEELDYHWSSTIIWVKDQLVLSRKDYHTQFEPIWYGWLNGESRLCPLVDRKQTDVWEIPRPRVSVEHPTMKPIELVARAINNSSKSKDLVIDMFGGSGTTLIAAEQTGRSCYMMELDPKYVDVIIKRWEIFTGNEAIKLEGNEE